MIQLTRQGLNFTGVEKDLDALRREFDRRHFLLLENFLHPEVVSLLLPMIRTATFRPKHYDHVGSELQMDANVALHVLSFLTNDLKLFDLVQKITSCGPVGCFRGRVYKLIHDPAHILDWHNDFNEPGRLIAMSLNLSMAPFRGGILQIRQVRGSRIVSEVANTGFGNAVIFRLSPDLEHQVTQVQGDAPRISFAGWFRSDPDIRTCWRQLRGDMAGVAEA
jgi:2-oxoglutarate-Fe(II)-dependent oxygenase superfamily protein